MEEPETGRRRRTRLGLEALSDRELLAVQRYWRRHRSHQLAEERLIAIAAELRRRSESED